MAAKMNNRAFLLAFAVLLMALPLAQAAPPATTLINLTSEGGLGPLVNLADKLCAGSGCTIPKTNSTTPSFFVKTNETATCAVINSNRDLNWTDIFNGTSNEDSGAGTAAHFLTLNATNATSIGLRNFSIGCKDSAGNENLISASGKFLVNITDPVSPLVSITLPGNGSVFTEYISNVINFTFNSTDNFFQDYSC